MATCPVVGTEVLDVLVDEVMSEPTAANETLVTVNSPAAVVFKTFSLFALPSTTASANLITCEYDVAWPAVQ